MNASLRFLRAVAALLTTALVLASATPSLGGMIYQLTNSPSTQTGNGDVWDLSGSIEVSRTGLIGKAEIVAYSWTITGRNTAQSYSFSGTGNEASVGGVDPLTALIATDSTLAIPFGSALNLAQPQPGDGNIGWNNAASSTYTMYAYSTFFWYTGSPSSSNIVSGSWVIGDSGQSVPEIDPAMGGSALSLVAGFLAMIEQRRRRAMLVA